MKKKKGFTLIELLAVIVVLAIIAVIAVPIILGIIDKAKVGAAKASALNYIDAVEKYIAISQIDKTKKKLEPGIYQVSKNTEVSLIDYIVPKVYAEDDTIYLNDIITVKGEKPTKGWVQISNKKVENYSIISDGFVVTKDENIVKGNEVAEEPDLIPGPKMIAAKPTETHKGIVYLDPTNLTKTCTEQNYNSESSINETKTGCMKWYVFDNTGDNYTMILDHNTTARIKWNDSNINVAYENSNLKAVVDALVTTSKWKVTPRLITTAEVAKITGNTGFNSSSTSSWYYLDNNSQTKVNFSTTIRSKYDWLYNNLCLCKTYSTDYGCTIEDLNTYNGYGTAGTGSTYAYWTSTPLGNAGASYIVWFVTRGGTLHYTSANNADYGIRPVITIQKSIIK